jgi:SRSO17 transposase
MRPQTLKSLEKRLTRFLEELTEPMGRSERRPWARVYIQGLLLDGERKSIEPMADRIAEADVQALRQFVGQSPWAVEEVQRRLALKAVDLLSEPEVWIIDETAFPKAGEHSVGVARQYCGTLGKVANCQVAVSLPWSSAEASCPLSWRLYLPKEWIKPPERAAEGKLPAGTVYRSKTELGLELIDQALDWQIPVLPVVADSGYGNDFSFRQHLRQRQLSYVVQVEPTTAVWTEDPNLPLPVPAPKRAASPPSPAGGVALSPRPEGSGATAACFGVEDRELARRQPGARALPLRQAPGLGRSRLAKAATCQAGDRMAADRMA